MGHAKFRIVPPWTRECGQCGYTPQRKALASSQQSTDDSSLTGLPLPFVQHQPDANRIESPTSPANGIPAPTRPSPAVSSSSGKTPSPHVERSNPMGAGSAQTVSSKDPKAVAQAATDMRNVVRRKLTGYVGFANLPNQWHRKSVRKGFNFNVMVVGQLVMSLCPMFVPIC